MYSKLLTFVSYRDSSLRWCLWMHVVYMFHVHMQIVFLCNLKHPNAGNIYSKISVNLLNELIISLIIRSGAFYIVYVVE